MTMGKKKPTPAGTGAAGDGLARDCGAPDRLQYTTTPIVLQAELRQASLSYAARGWAVFPCKPADKIPATLHGVLDATTDPEQITLWWAAMPEANIGLACGPSGLYVIDVDEGKGGPDTWRTLLERHNIDDNTPRSRTGGGGLHLLYRAPAGAGLRNTAGRLGPGIDTRANGGYIIAPPSRHPSGGLYAWDPDYNPDRMNPAPLPDALLRLLERPQPAPHNTRDRVITGQTTAAGYGAAALREELAELTRATEGTRNDSLNRAAFALGQLVAGGELDRTEVESALLDAALGLGLGDREALATIKSGLASGERDPRTAPPLGPRATFRETPEPPAWLGDDALAPDLARFVAPPDETPAPPGDERLTDLGNAARLVRLHGRDLRYCFPWGRWLAWDRTRWALDDSGEAARRAKRTVKTFFSEAAGTADTDLAKALAKHAIRSENAQRIAAMLTLAQSEPGIPVRPGELDADAWLLNVRNGTLDLRTGEVRPHRYQDMLTKLAPVIYDPAALCPTWDAFLTRIMRGDGELIGFLQRAIGYTLTGDVSEQVVFVLHGTGANGKSTFLEAIRTMLGDEYAVQTRPETLMIRQGETIPNDLARLKGARLVNARETEEGKRLAEALVKELSGGDCITARFLRQEYFDFRPEFKIFLAANHKPIIRGTDLAIWRRIRLVPFDVTIPESEQDRQLGAKLARELPGILAWAVRGCLAWQRDGLGLPAAVKDATATYRNESDILAGFLADCIVETSTGEVQAGKLYDVYKAWCDDNGEKSISGQRFGRRLGERGFDKYRKGNLTFYLGLELRA